MPAEPQQSSHSRGSSSSSPGMPFSSCARLRADLLGVREMAGVVVGGAQLDRLADGLRLLGRQQLVDVDDLGGELARAVGVEDVAVVLHHRAAAGDVGDDPVVALVGRDRLPRRAGSPPRRRPRASAARRSSAGSAGAWTSQPSALSTRTVAALTSPKNTRWMQPCMNATVPRLAGAFDVAVLAAAAGRWPWPGASASIDFSRCAGHSGASFGPSFAPGASARSRAGWVKTREDRLAVRALLPRARLGVLDLRPHPLDQLVVLHAGRARGHAGHAAEAAVEVGDHLGRDRLALLVADPHQQDAPARRVHLVLEDRVARARRQAEAAVHAVADQVQLGRLLLEIPGGRIRSLPRRRPGRKIRAGSKRAFRRSITTWPGHVGRPLLRRSAPSSTAQCARGERLADRGRRASASCEREPREPERGARDDGGASPRRRGSRSAGRSGGRRPSATTAPRCSARTSSQSTSAIVADRARPARPPTRRENCSRQPAPPSCPGDVEAVGLERPARELERLRAAARPGRRLDHARSRCCSGSGCRRTETVAISPSVPNEPANSFARS